MPRAGGGRNVDLLISGYRLSFWEDDKILEMDRGDDRTTMHLMELMPLNCKFKSG